MYDIQTWKSWKICKGRGKMVKDTNDKDKMANSLRKLSTRKYKLFKNCWNFSKHLIFSKYFWRNFRMSGGLYNDCASESSLLKFISKVEQSSRIPSLICTGYTLYIRMMQRDWNKAGRASFTQSAGRLSDHNSYWILCQIPTI